MHRVSCLLAILFSLLPMLMGQQQWPMIGGNVPGNSWTSVEDTFYPPYEVIESIRSGEHFSFQLKGIPNVFFNSGDHPGYHTPNDDADKINYEFIQKNCQFIYHLIMELANEHELDFKV